MLSHGRLRIDGDVFIPFCFPSRVPVRREELDGDGANSSWNWKMPP